MAEINSYPNNQDVYRGAEEVMRWFHGRTSGVYGADDNAAVTAVQSNMAVQVSDGYGWISNDAGDGVVWWIDNEKKNGVKLQLTVDPADGTLNRVDRVVIEWPTTNYVGLPEVKILKGSAASSATAPTLTNNSTVRQISLARITINAGTTALTPSMITDERLDPAVCGIVTEQVKADTSVINAQMSELLTAIQQELADLEAGTAVELKKLLFENTTVPASAFIANATYADYPFRASVALTGVTSSMIPDVTFSVPDAASGNFASAAATYSGGVYIYAREKPTAAITIPTIICWRGA